MKIKLFGLTLAATTLCFAPAAQSEVINNQYVKPVIDLQINQAVNQNNFVQGAAQSSNLGVSQSSVAVPGSISIPKIQLPGGSKMPTSSYAAPVVASIPSSLQPFRYKPISPQTRRMAFKVVLN